MGCLNVITITLFLVCKLKLFLEVLNYNYKETVMSYRDENSAQQSIRRNLNSVNLEPENRKALEAVAVMMAAAGKSGPFVTYMQALEKTETQVDLKTVADNVNNLVNVIGQQHKTETITENHSITKDDLALVMDRIIALEAK